MSRMGTDCFAAALTVLGVLVSATTLRAQTAPVDVQVTFLGAIALAPDGNGVPDDQPMASGEVERMWVLFPRAFDADALDKKDLPDMREFRPRKGKHRGHDLIVRVCAKYLVPNGEGYLTFPIPSPVGGTYRINIENVSKSSPLAYSGLEAVPPVMGRTKAGLELLPVPDDILEEPNDGIEPRLTAAMVLGDGWSLSALPTHDGTMGFMPCDLLGCHEVRPEGYPRRFPRAVTARIEGGTVPSGESVTLTVGYSQGATRLSLPLIPVPEGAAVRPTIKIELLHGPLADVLYPQPPDPSGEEHHFKLFYLIPNSVSNPYYFPYLKHTGQESDQLELAGGSCPTIFTFGDPFCTPLAQFVRRRGTKQQAERSNIR